MEAERNTLYVQYDDNGFFKIGPQIAFTYGETATDEANAHRLAAAWNACEGVANEDLEFGCYQKLVDKHVEVHFAKQDAEAQRDELLAALKGVLNVVNVRIDDPRIKQFDEAREAIAKAEGVQS